MRLFTAFSLLLLISGIVGCGGKTVQGPEVPDNLYLSLSPECDSLEVGDNVTLTGMIASVEDLFAASFDISFDTTVVRVDSVSIPPSSILGSSGSISFFNRISNGVSVGLGKMQTDGDDNVSGSGPLFEIAFTAIRAGSSMIEYENVMIIDQNGNPNSGLETLQTQPAEIVVE